MALTRLEFDTGRMRSMHEPGLPITYPDISHQTGTPQNHRLKSAGFKGDMYGYVSSQEGRKLVPFLLTEVTEPLEKGAMKRFEAFPLKVVALS